MPILTDTELMENQKHADVMAPDVDFDVLQTAGANSLFFSIGTDGTFYLTQELIAQKTGWNRQDLSTALLGPLGATSLSAKTFAIAQDPVSGNVHLALAVTANGADHLFLSLNNSNDDSAWAQGVSWTSIPYDDAGKSMAQLSIEDLYVLQTPQGQFIVADILANPGSTLNAIFRYYITPGASQQWNEHDTSADFSAGSVQSCLGQRTGDLVAGIYTFGTIASQTQLIFTPLFNPFASGPDAPPPSAVPLTIPPGATSIAAATNASGLSTLFVAASSALYVFTPDNQQSQATPVALNANPFLAQMRNLQASCGPTTTSVWGINQADELISISCPLGSEADPTAWTIPLPLASSVTNAANYLNAQQSNSTLFANTGGTSLIQLRQDPVSSHWAQRSILLPSTDIDDLYSFQSFTTHIRVADANNFAIPNAPLSIAASGQVSLYLNDLYYVLAPGVPLAITADITGVLTVVQETDGLASIGLTVTNTATNEVVQVNPMANANAKLATIQSGADLSAVQVTDSQGNVTPLIPAGTTTDQLNSTASGIQQLLQANQSLPADGSVQPATGNSSSLQGSNAITVLAGDFFRWLKSAVVAVENFAINLVDKAYHFFITIGNDIYHFVLDCLDTVAHALDLVFQKIAVFFDKVVQWIGFIFSWKDILRVHQVIRSVVGNYANNALASMATAQQNLDTCFDNVAASIAQWTGLTGDTNTTGTYQQKQSTTPGANSPQSNWAAHHTKSNASTATSQYTGGSTSNSTWDEIISQIQQFGTNEVKTFQNAINQFKADILGQESSLTGPEIVVRIAGILGDFIVTSVKNFLDMILGLIADMAQGAEDMLTKQFDIPIISKLYSDIAGEPLTGLNLGCLLVAIPATIIYKLVTESMPFPEGPTTTAIINATDFATVKNLLVQPYSTAPAGQLLGAAAGSPTPLLDVIFVCGVAAFFTSIVLPVLGAIKSDAGLAAGSGIRVACSVVYLFFVSPNIVGGIGLEAGTWYNIMNDTMTGLSIVKVFGDNIYMNKTWQTIGSPIVECIINCAWLAPAIGSIIETNPRHASDWLGLVANLGFDIGGAIAPATSSTLWCWATPPVAETNAAAFQLASALFGALYGTAAMVGGLVKLDGD